MATTEDRAPAGAVNDDIGEEKRLALYRTQVVLREAEQRAFDLFLQNLVKGTSHLSLGQEAVAAGFAVAMQPGDLSFCTYRGHAHTLARGVPVEKVLGELMQRDNGLMRGKGGSMHLTSADHGVIAAYDKARVGKGPSLIECLTYRHSGHSRADPAKYRPEGELEKWKERDPIKIYRERLAQFGIGRDVVAAIDADVKRIVDAATDAC